MVKIKPILRSTSPRLSVDVHPLHHLRPLPCHLDPCRAAQWPLSLPGSRCPLCSRCSRNRTASLQSRSPRAWTQWGSCRRESTGINLPYLFNTSLIIYSFICYLLCEALWASCLHDRSYINKLSLSLTDLPGKGCDVYACSKMSFPSACLQCLW